jgi:hypothetical protein
VAIITEFAEGNFKKILSDFSERKFFVWNYLPSAIAA